MEDPDSPINPDELIPKGLVTWREAVSRSNTSAQLAMTLHVLESCVAWDKSIMKAVSFHLLFFYYFFGCEVLFSFHWLAFLFFLILHFFFFFFYLLTS